LCADTNLLNLPPYGVTVVWEWEWISGTALDVHMDNSTDSNSTHCTPEENADSDSTHCTPVENSESNSTHCTPEDDLDLEPMDYLHKEQYTVTFKCIGCTRDDDAQDSLRYASQLFDSSTVVPVNIYPEPNNPYDRRAIAFKCWINNKWTRIGYVVYESLDDVHDAMSSNQITNVGFAWIKFLVC